MGIGQADTAQAEMDLGNILSQHAPVPPPPIRPDVRAGFPALAGEIVLVPHEIDQAVVVHAARRDDVNPAVAVTVFQVGDQVASREG